MPVAVVLADLAPITIPRLQMKNVSKGEFKTQVKNKVKSEQRFKFSFAVVPDPGLAHSML